MPEISVIVPVYDVEAFLPQCVASLLAQTFADFELILVDDGSPDGCGALCDQFARQDGRVRALHQPNGGLSSARNAGLDAAAGQYIAFVDSDDLVHPDYLRLLRAALQKTGADMAICGVEDVLENGQSQTPPALTRPSQGGTFAGQALLAEFYGPCSTYYTVAWNKLYKAELWRELRYPQGRIHEDDAVAHQLFWASGAVACLAAPLYRYRLRQGSICHTGFSPARFDGVEALAQRFFFFAAHNARRNLQDSAFAAAWQRYLYLCGELAQQPAWPQPVLERWADTQRLMRALLPGLPRCRALSLGQKLSCAKWCTRPPQKLLAKKEQA